MLVEAVQRLSLARDLPAIMAVVRQAARALCGADGVTVILREGDLCHYADDDAIAPLWKGQRFPMHACISGGVMLHGEPAVIEDIEADPRIPLDAYRLTFVRSLAMVPVRTEKPVAAIGAYWTTRHQPTAEEVARLQALAHSTAIAFTNLDLYQSLQATLRKAQREFAERRLAETALVQVSRDLERADLARTRFLAAASHDLRQPFQAMRLYQDMLAKRATDPMDRRLVAGLGAAMVAGEDLLKALLDVSCLDAGIVEPNRATFPLSAVLESVATDLTPEAMARRLGLRVRPGSAVIHSDPVLVRRIVRNLVDNAVRYTPEGGRVLLGCRQRGSHVLVQVWDTGSGIPDGMLEAVFEDFVQVGNPERDRAKGLGLGLGLARRMARLLGGTIAVRSRPGRGSVFTLVLDRTGAAPILPAACRAADRPDHRAHDPQTVLVIEDDHLQLSALTQLLEAWGFRVAPALTAEGAIDWLRGSPIAPELIITDLRLPGEADGIEAVARIGEAIGHPVPCIIVTGDTAPHRIQQASASGCRLIHKPYLPKALRQAITETIPA